MKGEESKKKLSSRIYDFALYAAIILGLVPLMTRHESVLMEVFDSLSCTLLIIDYFLRWYTYDIRLVEQGKEVTLRRLLLFPFTPAAIIDVLSILPTFGTLDSSFKALRSLRLLRLLRVFKATRNFKPLQLLINVLKREQGILLLVFLMAVCYIVIVALLIFNIDDPMKIEESGVQQFDSFFDALYWATCTLTTVGFGDIYPVTFLGRLISMVSSLFGVAIIALPGGVITAGYLQELQLYKERKKKVQQVNKSTSQQVNK